MDQAIRFPLDEIFPLLGCEPVAATAKSVTTDTRALEAGALFVALRGERFDGHDFLDAAEAAGAAGAVVETPEATLALPQCQVADARRALGRIAAWHGRRCRPSVVVGVTGSNGKTTVKEMLGAILSQVGDTLITAGNLNNDVGVPQMLLRLRPSHRFAVLEMGANHVGEIDWLASLAQPDIGVITQAAEAHVGEFGSLDAIIEAKGELIDHVREEGVVVLNADSAGFARWQARARRRALRTLSLGRGEAMDVRLLQARQTATGLAVALRDLAGETRTLSLPLFGVHHAWNAAAAVAVAQRMGVAWAVIEAALSGFAGAPGRMQPHAFAHGGLLLDDTYNANPASVRAAVETLVRLPGESWVCLGELAELGDARDALLRELGQWMAAQGVERLFALGAGAEALAAGFGRNVWRAPDHAALAERLAQSLQAAAGPVNVLVKGSRCARMENVIEEMRRHHAALFDGLAGAV